MLTIHLVLHLVLGSTLNALRISSIGVSGKRPVDDASQRAQKPPAARAVAIAAPALVRAPGPKDVTPGAPLEAAAASTEDGVSLGNTLDAGANTRDAIDLGAIQQFLSEQAVAESTADSYRSSLQKWVLYESNLNPGPGVGLGSVATAEEKALHIVMFVIHLYRVEGLRGEQVCRVLAALRWYHGTNEPFDESFYDTAVMSRARASCARTEEELVQHLVDKEERRALPLPREFPHLLIETHWTGRGWTTKEDLVKRGACLIILMLLNAGCRVGHFCPNQRMSHVVTAGMLQYSVLVGVEIVRMTGGGGLREFMRTGAIDNSQVLAMQFTLATTKTKGSKQDQKSNNSTALVPIVIGRSSPLENRVLDMLVEYECKMPALQGEDPAFTSYRTDVKGARTNNIVTRGGTQYLRRRAKTEDVRAAIKDVVSSQECGSLDPRLFNTRSARSTLATVAEEVGMSRERMLELGIWSATSTVADEFYRYSNRSVGLLASLSESAGNVTNGLPSAEELRRDMDNRAGLIATLSLGVGCAKTSNSTSGLVTRARGRKAASG